jgi:hypothetical protein
VGLRSSLDLHVLRDSIEMTTKVSKLLGWKILVSICSELEALDWIIVLTR